MATFHNEKDLLVAKEDRVVKQIIEHGVEVNRKVIAGTRIPPDLVEAYNAAGTTTAIPTARNPIAPDSVPVKPEPTAPAAARKRAAKNAGVEDAGEA